MTPDADPGDPWRHFSARIIGPGLAPDNAEKVHGKKKTTHSQGTQQRLVLRQRTRMCVRRL
jgi:hypothetical protein